MRAIGIVADAWAGEHDEDDDADESYVHAGDAEVVAAVFEWGM